MKRNIIRILFALSAVSALVVSCGPMEPSTYTETFFTIGTVQYKQEKASLLVDCTGETYTFTNFVTESDMRRFGVRHGDRVVAGMTLNAIGNIWNNELYMNEIYKYSIYDVADFRPSDSIHNYRYQLQQYTLNANSAYTKTTYPKAWSQGHIVNMIPSYNVSSDKIEGQFYLYPLEVSNNTLIMKLYSEIPDTLPAYYSKNTLLCFDMSSLRKQVADSLEQAHRDTILSQLESLKLDTINVEIQEPDIMRDIWQTKDGIIQKQYYNPRATSTLKLPFDF